jgi:hypothetical protein
VQSTLPVNPEPSSGVGFDVQWAAHLGAHGKWTRKTSWRHRTPAALSAFVAAYESGSSITELASAQGVNTSPFLLARGLVEVLMRVPRAAVGALVREPRLRIADKRLAGEVVAAAEADAYCSPYVDRLRAWAGDEGEWRLSAGLAARGLLQGQSWLSEEFLRTKRAARTPDVLFRWPIVVPCPYALPAACTGHVITWIDSKALFLDSHAWAEAAPQLGAYATLYGTGAVITWSGFIAELEPCCCSRAATGARLATAARSADCPLLLTALPRVWRWATEDEARATRVSPVEATAAASEAAPASALEEALEGPTNDAQSVADTGVEGGAESVDAINTLGTFDENNLFLTRAPAATAARRGIGACVGPVRRAAARSARLSRLAEL